MELPPGTWQDSSSVDEVTPTQLVVQCSDISGRAVRNTLVPVTTVAGLQLGSIVAFAIITETVFQWPGVGLMFINAVYFVDIPVMSAYLLLFGTLFVLINLIVDLLYLASDPRIRDRNLRGG